MVESSLRDGFWRQGDDLQLGARSLPDARRGRVAVVRDRWLRLRNLLWSVGEGMVSEVRLPKSHWPPQCGFQEMVWAVRGRQLHFHCQSGSVRVDPSLLALMILETMCCWLPVLLRPVCVVSEGLFLPMVEQGSCLGRQDQLGKAWEAKDRELRLHCPSGNVKGGKLLSPPKSHPFQLRRSSKLGMVSEEKGRESRRHYPLGNVKGGKLLSHSKSPLQLRRQNWQGMVEEEKGQELHSCCLSGNVKGAKRPSRPRDWQEMA